MKRILTAREQFDMLSPWTITAAPKQPKQLDIWDDKTDEGTPILSPDSKPQKVRVPKDKKERLPAPPPARAEGTQFRIPFWQQNDWRTGDGGKYISDVRPQIPEVDVPHPSEFLTPEQWEKQKAKLKDPEYDPHGVLPDGLTFEDIVQGEMKHIMPLYFNRDEQGRENNSALEGRWWYPSAHEITKDVSDKTIGDHERTVAEASAFSPKNEWDNNIENFMQFSLNYPGRPGRPYEETQRIHGDPDLEPPPWAKRQEGFDPENYDGPTQFSMPAMNVADAQAIRHAPGRSFLELLTGPKRQSFFRNIMDKSKIRPPRPGHHPTEDSGYYEMPINPFTGEPDWRMHPMQLATMDTQHHRMTLTPPEASDEELANLKYATQPWFSKKRVIDGPNGRSVYEVGYELQHRAHWEALRRLNAMQKDPYRHLIPPQAQAGPWLDFRHRLDRAEEKVKGKKIKQPEDLAKGVEPGRYPRNRLRHSPPGPNPLEGPEEAYFTTGFQEPSQESNKAHHFQRYQRDYAYEGDPDYNAPPLPHDDVERYLGEPHDPSGRFTSDNPGKKLRFEKRPVIPGTGWRKTPLDSRNELRRLDTLRNWNRRNSNRRFWAVSDWNAVEDHVRGQKYPGLTLRNELGDAPTSGYMVSLPGHEEVRPYDEKALARGDIHNVWTSQEPMSSKTLQQFNTDKNQVIESHPDNKQGGWEDDGDWFDDVSRHYDSIWDAAKQAYGETPEEAQHGFYDIKNEISPSPLEFIYKGEPAFFMARRLWKG